MKFANWSLAGKAGTAATVGFGMSPGDDAYAEPYWYVSPWPSPDSPHRPPLTSPAHWHDENFVAAVLTRTALLGDDQSAPAEVVRVFLRDGIEACRELALRVRAT